MYPIDIITLSGTAELRETDSAELVWLDRMIDDGMIDILCSWRCAYFYKLLNIIVFSRI